MCYNCDMNDTIPKPREYNRITPAQVAKYKALEAVIGNGSAAVRELTPRVLNVGNRAFRIRKKAQNEDVAPFIDEQLQQIGADAINRLGMLVNSTDERVATKNVHYTIDQIKGKATQKSITLSGKLNIQNVLD